jgi:hypothetical protein
MGVKSIRPTTILPLISPPINEPNALDAWLKHESEDGNRLR